MAIQEISILKNYMTCEDEAVRNKYYNLIDSFYHKSEGKILESISEDANAITLQFTDGNTATANTSVVIPKLPGSQDISFISGLQEALNGKVSTSPGKGLSDQNFSLAEKQKLSSLINYVKPNSEEISYINGLQDALDGKVAVEAGKGLSSNDFTDVLKQRLEAFSYNDLQDKLWERRNTLYNLKVPTRTELEGELASWGSEDSIGAFSSPLKLTVAGMRRYETGELRHIGTFGFYWASTTDGVGGEGFQFSTFARSASYFRESGKSVRLIVDGNFTQTEYDNNYQNESVIIDGLNYGFVYNPATQKVWLDRNLGATQVATSSTDSSAYGDLYQWGRRADGHEKKTSNLTTVQATTPQPNHGDFIITPDTPWNWLNQLRDDLWQGTTGENVFAKNPKLIGLNGLKVSYKDLKDLPILSDAASTGDYNDLLNKPDLSVFNDLVQANSLSDFPATGDTAKLYIALDTGYTYRWSGTAYVQLTDQTAIWGQISGTILEQPDLQSELKKGTITVDLKDALSVDFLATHDLRINTYNFIEGGPSITIKANDLLYTLGEVISQGEKISVSVDTVSVINLNVFYE